MDTMIVFDVDGVLVDVRASYRAAIAATVRDLTGDDVAPEEIQAYKNLGGYNNDWLLTRRLCADRGVEIPYPEVVARFHALFFGANGDGLIAREVWLPRPGWLTALAARHRLSLFTGRSRPELAVTLGREGCAGLFAPVVTSDDVERGKPAPDGLLAIRAAAGERARLLFVGDTVDDAGSARAAGVPFVGVVPPGSASPEASRRALAEAGAIAVLEDVHEVEHVAGEAWR